MPNDQCCSVTETLNCCDSQLLSNNSTSTTGCNHNISSNDDNHKTLVNNKKLLKQIIACTIGSIVSILILNPINVIKVQLQSSQIVNNSNKLYFILKSVYSQNGIKGFWSGTQIGLIMSVPNTVFYMSVYEELKNNMYTMRLNKDRTTAISSSSSSSSDSVSGINSTNHNGNNGTINIDLIPGLAGASARAASVTLISPLELIRTIQTGGVNQSILEIATKIISSSGYRGLYRGWSSSILRDCPFSFMYWLGFESLRPIYTKILIKTPVINPHHTGITTKKSSHTSWIVTFLSGASSGLLAAIVTHPFDVLKTNQQVLVWNNRTNNNNTSSPISIETATTNQSSKSILAKVTINNIINNNKISIFSLYNSGGILNLYRGLSMRLATVIPASAIMITIYEAVKNIDL